MNNKTDKARIAFTIASLTDRDKEYIRLKDNLINLLNTCESFPPLLKNHGDNNSPFAKAYQSSQSIIKRQIANYEEAISLIDELLSILKSINDDGTGESYIDICNYSLWTYSLITYDGFKLAEASKETQAPSSITIKEGNSDKTQKTTGK